MKPYLFTLRWQAVHQLVDEKNMLVRCDSCLTQTVLEPRKAALSSCFVPVWVLVSAGCGKRRQVKDGMQLELYESSLL